MSTSELRHRHTTTAASAGNVNNNSTTTTEQQQQQQATLNNANIPSNYFNAFYGNQMDANSVLAQQYAMQTWMQHAYAQYMSQYMNMWVKSNSNYDEQKFHL